MMVLASDHAANVSGAVIPPEDATPAAGIPAPRRAGHEVLVETKLYAPRARREWVPRDELVGQLAGTAGRLLLVEAPAGFRKTTLVAQWHLSAAEDRLFAWVSLDRGDNDPCRLWWHVAWALQGACPGFSAASVLAAFRD